MHAGERMTHVLRAVVRHPWHELLRLWSWKAMLIGTAIRALLFVIGNRHGSASVMLHATLTEAIFALPSAGLSGALTQRIALAEPQGVVGVIVWAAIPTGLLLGQVAVHDLAHTPHMRTGVIGSLALAAFGSGFTWFAMRRGVLLASDAADSFEHDARALPRLILAFVLAPLRPWLGRRY